MQLLYSWDFVLLCLFLIWDLLNLPIPAIPLRRKLPRQRYLPSRNRKPIWNRHLLLLQAVTSQNALTNAEGDSATTVSMDSIIQLIDPLLEETFENHSIDYDGTNLTINISQTGIAAAAALAATTNDPSLIESWSSLKENIVYMSTSTSEALEELGYGDTVLTIAVLNDQNEENILLMAVDNVIVYDALDDFS